MMYLLGGAARAGKTIIAHRLLDEKHIPYFCVDYFVSGLFRGAPGLGVDPDSPNRERGERVWPTLKGMLRNIVEVEPRYLVEGDVLLPKYVREIMEMYPGEIHACFVGYAALSPEQKLREIRTFGGHVNDWLDDKPDEYILELAREMIDFSRYLQAECQQCHLPYFDASRDFPGAISRAYRCLAARDK